MMTNYTRGSKRLLDPSDEDIATYDVTMYTPCNGESQYHDLTCGHRIKTEWHECCGSTCANTGDHYPFLCIDCIAERVRMELRFEKLLLNHGANSPMTDADQEFIIEAAARAEIDTYLQKGKTRLPLLVVPVLPPILQMFTEIPGAIEDGGILTCDSPTRQSEPPKRFKRPGQGRRGPIEKKACTSKAKHEVKEQNMEGGCPVSKPVTASDHTDDGVVLAIRKLLRTMKLDDARGTKGT